MKLEHEIYTTAVRHTIVYGCETMATRERDKNLQCSIETRMLRLEQDVSLREHNHIWEVMQAAVVMPMDMYLTRRRLQW